MNDSNLKERFDNINLENNDGGEKWGMPLNELYRLSLAFYKDKTGKAIHTSYEDNLKLIAYTQQAIHGPFNDKSAPPLGVFDVIGRDRRLAWQNLGSISKLQAMEGFINLLDRLCPTFRPYVEAIKKDKEERMKKEIEEEKRRQEEIERENKIIEEQKKLEEQKNKEEIQKRQLQEALNQQTYHQFKAYAEKQFPSNPEQQAILIKQLQTEHYHQYMQQLQAHQNAKESELKENKNKDSNGKETENFEESEELNNKNINENCTEENDKCEIAEEPGEYLVISPAKMWTRPDIKAFKEEVSTGSGGGVIHVDHGDTVTVRVPTNENGNCIFWEFATDDYDIGFGVYFEWGKSVYNEVTVHVSESDDEEEIFEDDDDDFAQTGDIECGSPQTIHQNLINQSSIRPPISIIVPVYRRECHNEVYVGSHNYPGEGVYLLKFDNSFSIWRSKTLYYRVYYER